MNLSPLAKALRFESAAEVRRVLEAGADPNRSGDFHISSDGFEEKVELLLKHGWEINRCQLLHDAKHGLGKRVQFYLAKGADPTVVDSMGQNALHKFAKLGVGQSAIHALVKAGASLSAEDENGKTPMDLAKDAKRDAALKALTQLSREQHG